jgi:hypothetical protein
MKYRETIKIPNDIELANVVNESDSEDPFLCSECQKHGYCSAKFYERNKMPTAHSGTFACPYAQATASQAKEPEFLPTL